MTLTAAPRRARTASPLLYEELRRSIISLDFRPGEPLSRVELAARFKVSQTPVREALLKLAEERLVEVYPQAATKVSLIDLGFAREAHFLRRSLELEIVGEVAGAAPPGLIERLESIVDRQAMLDHAEDHGAFTALDHAFHRALYEAAGREGLWTLVQARSGHIDRLRRLHLPAAGKRERIVADHSRILDALRRGDGVGARNALRDHLSETLGMADLIRADHPQFFTSEA